MEISSILFGGLDLIPNHAGVFQTPREVWNPCFLHRHIYVDVLFQVDRKAMSHYTEKDCTFYVQEADLAKLADVPTVLFLGD